MVDERTLVSWLAGSVAVIAGMMKWLVDRGIRDLDKMKGDIEDLQEMKICKKDLDDTEERLSRTIIEATQKIQHEVENTSRRVDKLFERGTHL